MSNQKGSATNYPPQQVAQGAVAHDVAMEGWHSAVDAAGELCTNAPDERYRTRAESVRQWIVRNKPTTPPAPVDVRVPMSRIIELLAQLVNAPQTDDEFDADVIRRDVVMEKVTQLRMAWDELSKAQRALLDGQPAGVVIDDAMVSRACDAFLDANPAHRTVGFKEMRAALQAALGGGGGRG